MKLKKLIAGLNFKIYGHIKEKEILSLVNDSRIASPNSLFIAKKGNCVDGNSFIGEAINNGSIAVVSSIYNPLYNQVVQLITEDVEKTEALLAKRFYEDPSSSLYVVGITGTNGKTTISFLLKHVLDKIGYFCGLIGTIKYIIGEHSFDSTLTTPCNLSIQNMMKKMICQGCKAVSMEVSSIGLLQERTRFINFNAAIFTNLTRDHLDIHKTLEAYALEKKKLFQNLSEDSIAIVNNDSCWSKFIVKDCKATIFSYGFSNQSDLWVSNFSLDLDKTIFEVNTKDFSQKFVIPLIGKHNIYNVLSVIALMHFQLKVSLYDLSEILKLSPIPKGRLELVPNNYCKVFVDYAHTPDALENVLSILHEMLANRGKLIIVFGCGGDRDVEKRSLMAKVSEKYGLSIVTSDNPRTEDPIKIIQDIEKGFTKKNYCIEIDRQQAISKALEIANQDDIVLIAGKGHETYQRFAYTTIPFDDYEVALNFLSKKRICSKIE